MTETMRPRQPVRWPWVPRSWTAASLWLVGAVLVAAPVILLAFITLVSATGCFIECDEPDPGYAAFTALAALVLAAMPFAAVRYYQGAASEPVARRRLAVLALIVLVGALVQADLMFDGNLLPWL
jgi:hypothetical protein